MKKLIALFSIVLYTGLLTGIGQNLTEVKFEKMDHIFGKISEDNGLASAVFNFANIGKVPLIISAANASCGCTTPEWSKEPVLPGKTGFIKVSYDPKNRPGVFNKTITVYANVPNSSRVLTISGEVVPHIKTIEEQYPSDLGLLRMKNNYMAFVKVTDKEIKTDTLFFYNSSSEPITIGYKFLPPYIKVKSVPETVQPKAKGYFLISWDGKQKNDYGLQMNRVYLLLNGKDDTKYALTVSATIEEDFFKIKYSRISGGTEN